MKPCPKCGDQKADFYKEKGRCDGLSFYCKECCKKGNKKRHQKFKAKRAAKHKVYVDKNRPRLRAKTTAWRKNLRLQVLHHYTSGQMSCACCGESNPEFLCIDHTDGGGNKHRKQIGYGGYAIYIWLRQQGYPSGFRVLCFNCNYAVIGGKSCPHTYRSSARTGGILSGKSIQKNIEEGFIRVEPFQPEHLNPASIDLTLGKEVVEYEVEGILDARKPSLTRKYTIGDDGIVLLPGCAYLMHTEEVIRTDRYITVLDGKSSLGRLFISVHATAGYIDAGFEGQVTLEVTVTHPVRVYAGMRFCQVRFHSIVGKPELYNVRGHYVGDRAKGAVPSLCYEQVRETLTR